MAVYMLIVGFCILQDSVDDIAGFLLGSVDDNAGVLHGSVDDNAGVLPELTPNHGHPLLCLPHSFLHLCLEGGRGPVTNFISPILCLWSTIPLSFPNWSVEVNYFHPALYLSCQSETENKLDNAEYFLRTKINYTFSWASYCRIQENL